MTQALAIESMAAPVAASHNHTSAPQEFLTFRLGSEEYGIEILKVQEIRGWEQPTTIANAPEFIKGVINLRGTIVPIVDMRIHFNLGEAEYNTFTVVIILNVGNRVVGMVVDSVSDVVLLPQDQIKPAPQFSSGVDTSHINGIGTAGERMLIMMDIEKLMLSPQMGLSNPGAAVH